VFSGTSKRVGIANSRMSGWKRRGSAPPAVAAPLARDSSLECVDFGRLRRRPGDPPLTRIPRSVR